ncbi:zinc finger CCCH domain-containing protein 10-like [Aricia agestis]|uniref:zinc finger CCCH domain-containing protein 10-like n=1 Tax=Aricia agestis TaxID=91739 RepID=UPI001C20BDEE|nr:zinc finger CCCH domain-containing protein 10-like [Aricia agestis]
MIGKSISNSDATMNNLDDSDVPPASSFCRDFIRGYCSRENCRYIHEIPPKSRLKELFRFCHDFQNKGCFRPSCKFTHSTVEDEELFYTTGIFPRDPRSPPGICQAFLHGACSSPDCKFIHPRDLPPNDVNCGRNIPNIFNRPPPNMREDESPPEAKLRKFAIEEPSLENQGYPPANLCQNCDVLEHKIKLLYDNISVLLNKVADLTEKNGQLTSMNEFLLQQTASLRGEQSCVITSRHGTSAPVSLATVSVTPVVSLAGAIPALMPAAATPNLALAPAASRAQLLTPAPQILTVSTTQQLVGNSGALIVTSAGAQQLMQVSDSGTLMGGGQTVVAVTPAQLTLGPTQQLMTNASQTAVQQLVQTSALQPQLASQHQASQFAQQSVQHLAAAQQSAQHLAQQSAQHLAQQSAQHLAQHSAQHLAAQQSAQHLAAAQQSAQQLAAAQQSAQQLAAQQSAQQQLVPSGQQLVHQTSTQQITISNTSQPMALPNSQAQPLTFPIISQSILPH